MELQVSAYVRLVISHRHEKLILLPRSFPALPRHLELLGTRGVLRLLPWLGKLILILTVALLTHDHRRAKRPWNIPTPF